MTEYRSAAASRAKRSAPARALHLELTPAEQVAVTGALQRDLKLPDVDHATIRDLLVRLVSA